MELIIELAEAELDEVSGGAIRFSSFSVGRQNSRGGDAYAFGGAGGNATGDGDAAGGAGGVGGTATGGNGGINVGGVIVDASTTPDAEV